MVSFMKQGSNLLQKSKTQGEPNYLMPGKKNGVTVLPFTHLPEASSITKHHLSLSCIAILSVTTYIPICFHINCITMKQTTLAIQ